MLFGRSLVFGVRSILAGVLAVIGLGAMLTTTGRAKEPAGAPVVTVKVVAGGESAVKGEQVSQWIVGPGINEPDPFPGWGGPIGKGGTVGWGGVGRSKSGTLVVAFHAGYWHAEPPTGNPVSAGEIQRLLAEWSGYPRYFDKIGAGHTSALPAPTGGRILFMRSEDGGKTWSKPKTLADTPADDRQAGLLALPDGTWICTWFTYMAQGTDPWGKDLEVARQSHTFVARSFDDGRTWTKPMRLQTQDFWPTQAEGADGPPVLMKDGSILLAAYGFLHTPTPCHLHSFAKGCEVVPIWKSTDEGKSWKLLSAASSLDDNLEEPHIAELPDGRMVMVSREMGNITWSSDHGKTWTPPVHFMHMMASNLTVLKDGTLLCVYGDGDLRATFSTDGGKTWMAADPKHGFIVAKGVWGYGADVLLPDGSVYIVYQHSAIRTPQEIKDAGFLAVRLRVRPDHSGIDLLAPDPQAVLGRDVTVAAK